jgi:hypothetical protein
LCVGVLDNDGTVIIYRFWCSYDVAGEVSMFGEWRLSGSGIAFHSSFKHILTNLSTSNLYLILIDASLNRK